MSRNFAASAIPFVSAHDAPPLPAFLLLSCNTHCTHDDKPAKLALQPLLPLFPRFISL